MKTAFFGLGLAAIAGSVNGIDYEVAACAELADVDDTTVTSLTITSTPFQCDSYTRFRVRNDMLLKSDSPVVFSNFALKVLGTLTVEPDVTFQDVTEQVSVNWQEDTWKQKVSCWLVKFSSRVSVLLIDYISNIAQHV